jgi:phage gp36-like protein
MALSYIDKATMVLFFGEKELIQLTDRTNTGTIGDTVLDRAMATAESEANSYLGANYTLPLPTVPDVLKSMVGDIARYRLYDERPTEEVQKRYDRAVSWLRDVSKGVVSLGIQASDAQPESTIVVASSRTQVFTDALFGTMGPKWPTP